MSIRRAPRPKGNFTILDNAIFAADLSYRAMGLLAYLLSKPDHWEVSAAHLVNAVADSARPDGRDSVYAIIDELIAARFIVREQVRAGGKMAGYSYEVFDTQRQPFPALPDTAPPNTAQPTQVNTEDPVNTDGGEIPHTPAEDGDDAAFEETWRAYPKRAGGNSRKDARKAWDARRKAGVSAETMLAGVRRYAAYLRATRKENTQFVKQAATFFGPGHHFEEEWTLPAAASGAGMHQLIDDGSRPQDEIEDQARQQGFRLVGEP